MSLPLEFGVELTEIGGVGLTASVGHRRAGFAGWGRFTIRLSLHRATRLALTLGCALTIRAIGFALTMQRAAHRGGGLTELSGRLRELRFATLPARRAFTRWTLAGLFALRW